MRILTPLLLAAAFVACESAVDVMAPDSTPQFARSSRAPVAQASAGGKLDVSPFQAGLPPETYGMSASVNADGNAKGQLALKFSLPDVKFHMEISCLSVAGNQAWLGGTVTHTHDAATLPVGTSFVWTVVDNGEGKKATGPDQMSFFIFADPSICEIRFDAGLLFDWLHGNIQVRGSTDAGGPV